MMSKRLSRSSSGEKASSLEEKQVKITEVRKLIHPLSDKLPNFCSDATISRYLRARNWNTQKASKMLEETLKWRLEYKPEAIRWENIANEATTGKIYRADYLDKFGRPVLVMRPGFQNTTSTKGQIKYLVYCMENAILNMPPDQEQMVWLIDFQGWTMASVSIKATRETTHVLQNYYPERLAVGIVYNPPKLFESFWKIVKPFLEKKTFNKVKFVYSNDIESQKTMADIFDMDKLESAFGGGNPVGFDFEKYAARMKDDDKKMVASTNSNTSSLTEQHGTSDLQRSEPSAHSEASSEASSSSDVSSPKSEGIRNILKDEAEGQSSFKSSAVAETAHQADPIRQSGTA